MKDKLLGIGIVVVLMLVLCNLPEIIVFIYPNNILRVFTYGILGGLYDLGVVIVSIYIGFGIIGIAISELIERIKDIFGK
ncbi:hypothetical protein CS063_14175 [Sporanaerobium hydrogeniformans]|uniref:Uncharacterized protein n=1 Tax=Sporanaerobium hydrogeniformans TaxID=3072179 RepID=A0AC61DA27_9FIRM|nr:hypothetical protein [Sporanaerobium hydrogeniformans]PHV69740.1 hypothetical protein CS063_14175 [Sporanaerobium hydrogeniformans]